MIGAAIVGLGWWGRTIARALEGSALIRPVLGVDPDPASRKAAGLPEAETLEAALAHREVQAVILCTPHRLHATQICAAAAAGKHVFCEKPLCTSVAEVDAALEAVTRAGVVLGIGHERRFEPAVIELRQRAGAGEFGTLLAVEANFSQDKFLALPPDNWRLSATDAPVGPLSATGIHLVDLSIALLGEPVEVWARLATRATIFANGDTLSVTMGFASGATALINAILATPFNGRLALFGSRGWVAIEDRTHPENPSGWDVTTSLRAAAPERRFFPPHPAVRDNLHAFAHAIDGVATYPVSHAEMRANVRAFAAITRSAASGVIERI
jgi:predicted dehydrogenase